jgi:hypothetical protein
VKDNIANIQSQFKDANECYIIIQVRKIGDAAMYRKYIKDAIIIETTEMLDFSNCGITKFPGLICYNEHKIPIKIYNDITQKAPILHNKMFDVLCKDISKFKHIPLIENDSVSYISFAGNSAIFNDKLYFVDVLALKLHKININTGILESSFNLNNTAISNALLEDKYRTDEYFEYTKTPSVSKVYNSFYKYDSIFIVVNSTKKIDMRREYIEELEDTANIIEYISDILLISMDTNYNCTFNEFISENIYYNTKHNFSWDFYIKNNYLLFTLVPDDKNIGSSVYLLAKYDINKSKDSINYELIYPYIVNKQTTTSDYVQPNKIIDNNDNIFIINTALNVFAKIDAKGNKTDFNLQGSFAIDNYCFNDTNISNAIQKNNNVRPLFLDELNDSLIITGLLYNISPTHKFLCVQTYKKDGKFINEKIYNLETEDISSFDYSCIYKNDLVFVYRKEGKYNLVFISLK